MTIKPRLWSFCLPVLGLALFLAACSGGPAGDAPPAPPTGLAATAGDEQVTLAWQANREADLAGYNIYRGTRAGSLVGIAKVPAGQQNYTDSPLANGTTYFYAIAAEDLAGQKSARSAEVSAAPTAPGADTRAPAVVATDPEDGTTGVAVNDSFTITFSEPMDGASVESALESNPMIGCSFGWDLASRVLSCQATGGLAPNTLHTVSVGTGAKDLAGNALSAAFTFSFTTGTEALSACVFGDSAATFGNCVFGP